MSFNIGEKGYVAVSKSEETWGTTGASEEVELLKILSDTIDLGKERRSSAALEGGRGTRSSVQTSTSRSGGLSLEVTPEAGIGYLFKSLLGDYNAKGTATAGASTDLDGSVSAGASSIIVTSAAGIVNDEFLQIGADDATGTEVVKVQDISGAPTLTIYGQLEFDHDDATAVDEVVSPFTHNITRTDNVDLPSLTIFDSLGGSFGRDWKGSRINSGTLNFSVGENISMDVDVISKDYAKRLAANLLTSTEQDNLRTINDPFIFEKGCLTKDSVNLAGVKSGSISINNNLNEGTYLCDNGDLSSLVALRSEVTVTLEVDWEDSAVSWDDYIADTSLDLVLTFDHDDSNYELVIDIPEFEIGSTPHNLEPGILSTTITGTAIVDSGHGYDVQFRLKDTNYSYGTE